MFELYPYTSVIAVIPFDIGTMQVKMSFMLEESGKGLKNHILPLICIATFPEPQVSRRQKVYGRFKIWRNNLKSQDEPC